MTSGHPQILTNKPLVEAIFELKWQLSQPMPGVKTDPHYKLLVGQLYEKLRQQYPHYESLQAASIPDELADYTIQHRFRHAVSEWPLVQIGPGVVTVNDTSNYVWADFQARIRKVVRALYDVYPRSATDFRLFSLLLRYIDKIDFDYSKDNVFSFMRDHMKVNVDLYSELFRDTSVEQVPQGLDIRFAYNSSRPKGLIHLRFARGQLSGKDVLVWETMMQSLVDDVGDFAQEDIFDWLTTARTLVEDWFFKIIAGKLLERFT